MTVNFEKVKTIVIRDKDGRMIEQFEIKQASLITFKDKTKQLELTKKD